MAISAVPKTLRDGKLKFTTGSGTTLTVQYEAGDFSISGLREAQTTTEVVLDRGAFHTVVRGSFEPATWSFTCNLTDLSDATAKTIPDICLKSGSFASEDSTLGSGAGRVWATDLEWYIEGTPHGDASDHVMTVTDNVIESLNITEGSPNTMALSGMVLGTVTLT